MPPQTDRERGRADPTAPLRNEPWLIITWTDGAAQGPGAGGGDVSWFVSVAKKIWGFLTGSKAALWKAITTLGNLVVDVANGLAKIALKIGVYFARVGTWLALTVRDVLMPLVSGFFDAVKLVAYTLRRFVAPIVDVLWRVRAQLLAIYRDYIRPVLDVLDAIQAFLRILELFNIKWAEKLDRWIEDVEGFINEKFNFLLAQVNRALGWIDRIVTLDGLLQRALLLQSLIRDAKHAGNLWWNTMHRPLTPEEARKASDPVPPRDLKQAVEDMRAYVLRGEGPDAKRYNEAIQNIKINLRRS